MRRELFAPSGSISKCAVPLPWPKVPAPETLMLQVFGGSLSDSDISPSNDPPTAATFSCMPRVQAPGPISLMLLQPGTQRVSTLGSLTAIHSASTDSGIASVPPISNFTGQPHNPNSF